MARADQSAGRSLAGVKFSYVLILGARESRKSLHLVVGTGDGRGKLCTAIPFSWLSTSVDKSRRTVADGPLVERYYRPVNEFRTEGNAFSKEGIALPPRGIPEEDALKIVLDKPSVVAQERPNGIPGGMNIEMGALFVDEALPLNERNLVWGELWLHTLRMAHHSLDDEVNFYGTTIHAYADKASKKLYLPLGFELFRHFVKDGKEVSYEGPDDSIPPVTKPDGSLWWPIVCNPEKITEFVKNWRAGKVASRDGGAVAQRMVGLADPRDGELIALSAQEMKTLVRNFSSKGEGVWHGANYVLNRLTG